MLGCFLWVKGAVKSLADPRAVFSFFNKGGLGVLHLAPVRGHIEVCKYLVEELRGDVNAPAPGVGGLYLTLFPFMEIGICHVYVWHHGLSQLCCCAFGLQTLQA